MNASGLWQSAQPVKSLRYVWFLLPAAGLFELLGHGYFRSRAPTDADWDSLGAPLAALRTQEELVVVAPNWAEPHARRVFGDTAMPLRDVARPDESGYPKAIEISVLGERALPAWTVLSEKDHGKFTLRELQNPDYQAVHLDFVDHFSPETVEAYAGASREPCTFNPRAQVSNGALHGHPTFPKERFDCGGSSQFVGVTVIEDERYQPRRCLWADPTKARPIAVRFKQVTLHERLRGYGGISYFDERDGGGGSVQLEVRAGDKPLGQYQHAPGEGWTKFEFSTADFKGQTHDVEFRVRALKGRPRGFCFQADLR